MTQVPAHILAVDDEPGIRRVLRANLAAHGYEVEVLADGAAAWAALDARLPDLVLLDLMLPDIDGLEILRRLRERSQVPVIVLSARGEDRTKVMALDLGADDYLTKPFSLAELLARVRVSLRHAEHLRGAAPPDPLVQAGQLTIDLDRRQVRRGTDEVHLTPTELSLLLCLARHADRVVTHATLLREVWGRGYGQETQYLHVYIGSLRRKLGEDPLRPQAIVTEPGTGYRLRTSAESHE